VSTFFLSALSWFTIEIEANNLDIEIEKLLTNKPPLPINITYHHLRRSIASLKNKNSTGMDGVSNRIIKLLPPGHLSRILSCLNNFAAVNPNLVER